MSLIYDPTGYSDFLEKHRGRRYKILPENAFRATKHRVPQVEALVEGLLAFAKRMGTEFTVSDVSVWLDKMHDGAYVRTEMGAARVFVYYLPELRSLGIVEQLK